MKYKKLVFTIIAIFLSLGFVNLLLPLMYSIIMGTPYEKDELINNLIEVSQIEVTESIKTSPLAGDDNELNRPASVDQFFTHPYIGYTSDKAGKNKYGQILGYKKEVFQRTEDKLIVVVLGGSVAKLISKEQGTYIQDSLSQATGKEITFVNLAVPGYKQPQQLMVLSYILSLGAEIDIVINIDGYNEVALSPIDNVALGVNPFYPRDWFYRTSELNNPESIRSIAKTLNYEENRRNWALFFLKYKLSRTNTTLILWKIIDIRYTQLIYQSQIDLLNAYQSEELPYDVSGPDLHTKTKDELIQEIAGVWAASSTQLDLLSKANGARYFHFLQPNQYVAGSKPMSEAEIKIAINPNSLNQEWVELGYPVLNDYGNRLAISGENFYDLTYIFENSEEVLYKDDCCHFNIIGNQLLAEEIVKQIILSLNESP